MVCLRCKILVQAEIEKLGLHCLVIKLGEIEIDEPISEEELHQLNSAFKIYELELLEDKKIILVENIRSLIIEIIHYSNEIPKINFSHYISGKLNCSYNNLSHLFSEIRHTTIEHYIILQKIERAKELISYDELSLSEIASNLHYSSVAHLSHQFKQIVGTTPTQYKNTKQPARISLDLL